MHTLYKYNIYQDKYELLQLLKAISPFTFCEQGKKLSRVISLMFILRVKIII